MKSSATALGAAFGMVLFAMGGADASPQGKKIAYLTTSPTHPFITRLTNTFVERAKALGMEVTSSARSSMRRCRRSKSTTPSFANSI